MDADIASSETLSVAEEDEKRSGGFGGAEPVAARARLATTASGQHSDTDCGAHGSPHPKTVAQRGILPLRCVRREVARIERSSHKAHKNSSTSTSRSKFDAYISDCAKSFGRHRSNFTDWQRLLAGFSIRSVTVKGNLATVDLAANGRLLFRSA